MSHKIIASLTALVMLLSQTDIYGIIWASCNDDVRKQLSIPIQANACNMTETEFEYLARVVQAESDGSTDWSDLEDKILIACVVLNRVESSRFPNTIQGVLDQSGQFTTTSGGWCSTAYTDSSRWAIVEAQRHLASGDVPDNLLYFNCIGYSYGTPYDCVGGNYFTCA